MYKYIDYCLVFFFNLCNHKKLLVQKYTIRMLRHFFYKQLIILRPHLYIYINYKNVSSFGDGRFGCSFPLIFGNLVFAFNVGFCSGISGESSSR
jgi:hypothetical protein